MSKTFVALREDEPARICGYYALTLAEFQNRHLPVNWRKKLPHRIPGLRLSRLAVDKSFQGKGLGEWLLVDALTRTKHIALEADGIGLFVDAIDEQTARYYRQFDFEVSPDNPRLLYLPAQVIG